MRELLARCESEGARKRVSVYHVVYLSQISYTLPVFLPDDASSQAPIKECLRHAVHYLYYNVAGLRINNDKYTVEIETEK